MHIIEVKIEYRWRSWHSESATYTINTCMELKSTISNIEMLIVDELEIRIMGKLSPEFGHQIGKEFNGLLHNLPDLRRLMVHGCMEDDYGMLSPCPPIPHVMVLDADFAPSQQFHDFLNLNPTITQFINDTADRSGFFKPGVELSEDILPNLEELSADYSILPYYLSARPVSNVNVLHCHGAAERKLNALLPELKRSTAYGGTRKRGGVLDLTIGWKCPLPALCRVVPNLQHLTLKGPNPREADGASDFWMDTEWGNDFNLFHNLRTITAVTEKYLSLDERSENALWRPKGGIGETEGDSHYVNDIDLQFEANLLVFFILKLSSHQYKFKLANKPKWRNETFQISDSKVKEGSDFPLHDMGEKSKHWIYSKYLQTKSQG
ncbi:hypothetical protein BU17DRAFT_70533 [Hysterangium stoloniferum]|nr:hypothetical protein BU17DRAFT_70533 [Hysterangium stoloniferum]